MTWISAKANKPSQKTPRRVVFVVYPGAKLLDLTGPLQVFNDASGAAGEQPAYEIIVASLAGGDIATDTALSVPTVRLSSLTRRTIDSLIVVGGVGVHEALQDPALVRAVERLHGKARRTASVCTGAFLLAEAGLLAGKRAVTHWSACKELAANYPQVAVEADPIFIKEGSIWTSAGVTAGIDLALAMVAEDLSRPLALALARSLVAYMVRPGGQSQFSGVLERQLADSESRFDDLHRWISENLNRDLRVEALADRLHMSPRSFARRYRAHSGQTPAKAVEGLRVEAARELLAGSDLPVTAIAQHCGFGDDERMRCAFRRRLHVAPSDYRQRFRT